MRIVLVILFSAFGSMAFGQSSSTHYRSNVSGLNTHGDLGKSTSYQHKIVNTWTEAHEQKSTHYSNRLSIGVVKKTTSVKIDVPHRDDLSLKVYPNPFTQILNLELDGSGEIQEVQVLNLKGQNVYEHIGVLGASADLDLKSIPVGVYIVKIKVDGFYAVKRVVKM